MLVITTGKLLLAAGILSHSAEQPSVGTDEAGTLGHCKAQKAVGTSGYD